ncbi:MAG: iron-containing alcohol dehydrogenase family protein [Planctomycetes bacterium]|nr:iron-containing alcohol dehydrogenase family protein [Planctomycetota bacterium]
MKNDLPVPEFGHNLIENLNSKDLGRYIVYTQEVPWKLFVGRFKTKPLKIVMIEHVGLELLINLLNDFTDCDSIVAFGGGLAIDSAKFVAWKKQKRFIAIPTVISADVSLCRSVAVREDWKVRYIGDKMPDCFIIDFDVIQSAPTHINRGGVCDILSCYTALKDWEIAHDNTGETIDQQIVDKTRGLLGRLFSHQQQIFDVTEEGIRFLIEGYLEEVRLCETYGSPRPEEGSEHFFAYNLEYRMRRPFLHGSIVSLGVVLMTILQERDPREIVDFLDGAGVLWKPIDMGLADEDILGAIETLYDYCINEKFYYTVVNHQKPDKSTGLRLLKTIEKL